MDQSVIDKNKMALDYHISNIERVKQICEPLKHLNITTFGYLKIFDDSRYLHICNKDKWSRHYFKNIHDDGETLPKAMALVDSKKSMFIWPTKTEDSLLTDLKNYRIWHGMSFCRRKDNFVENWSFCTDPKNEQISNFYLKHYDLLWKFVEYFTSKAGDLLDCSDSRKFATYKNGVNISSAKSALSEQSIKQFLNEIEINKFLIRGKQRQAFLSKRERDCLQLLSRGFTHKNIARQLDLSPRTVEQYINNVKYKLETTNKIDIINAFEESIIDEGIVDLSLKN